jgi:predicted Zn-ribbon and HTH transcriptional regulator
MTIYVIRIKEYECAKCGYKWIDRINGKDGPIPERCAKCKRVNWNGGLEIEVSAYG